MNIKILIDYLQMHYVIDLIFAFPELRISHFRFVEDFQIFELGESRSYIFEIFKVSCFLVFAPTLSTS